MVYLVLRFDLEPGDAPQYHHCMAAFRSKERAETMAEKCRQIAHASRADFVFRVEETTLVSE